MKNFKKTLLNYDPKILEIINFTKEKFNLFTIWISNLSWGKFILFIIIITIISDNIQKIFWGEQDDNFLHALTALFILFSFCTKILMKSKVKAEEKAKDAIIQAENESLLRQLSEAKVQLLQAQIEPHFLFNTLSSLQFLIETDQKKANVMLSNLISYLRYIIPQTRDNNCFTTLGAEVKNIQSYLDIMKIRMGERLQTSFHIPQNLYILEFPVMMLQPIIENSIKYGIEEAINGGEIILNAQIIENFLYVSVSDTGEGINTNSKAGNGIALNNIKNRLNLFYGNEAELILQQNQPKGFIATIKIPLNKK